jgi:hypothetical protein
MRPLLALLLIAFPLFGCPKRTETTVAGTTDEQMDQWAAELEELRARAAAQEGGSPCPLADRACTLAPEVCRVAGQSPEREPFQRQCGRAQEDCASLREACAREN